MQEKKKTMLLLCHTHIKWQSIVIVVGIHVGILKKKKHGKLYVCYVFKQCEGDVTCVVRNKERRRSKNTEEKIHKLLSIRCERMNGAKKKIRTKV